MEVIVDPRVPPKFATYPPAVRLRLQALRELVVTAAEEAGTIEQLEETLKWGEPSYLTKKGSTIRMDWKARAPEQYCLYFKCTSALVPTIRQLYGALFTYENNRALIFQLDEEVPVAAVKTCIGLALRYHELKHLPLLGQ